MKTYLAGIIPKIKKYSEKLDNLTLLTNQHWVVLNELQNSKFVYIFRNNYELLISENGVVEKGRWEYLGNNSLLIEKGNKIFLFRHGFFDSNILALKIDGREEYAFLVNENNYGGDLNNIEKVLNFLEDKYLKIIPPNQVSSPKEIEYLDYKEIVLNQELNPIRNNSGKYGYLDKNKNVIIDFKYDGADYFSEGLARVYKTVDNQDLYGFIDEFGNEIIPLKYEYALPFKEGLAIIRMNRKLGYINKSNNIIIDIQFDDAKLFHNGKAKVSKGSESYYINSKGEAINK